jgi:hypothetical protein
VTILISLGRYEISLGQQSCASGSVVWEFSIENVSTTVQRAKYKVPPRISLSLSLSMTSSLCHHIVTLLLTIVQIRLMRPEDESWLAIDRARGVLEHPGVTHTIKLTLSPRRPEVYCAYLIVENKYNPTDSKILKLSLEVPLCQAGGL